FVTLVGFPFIYAAAGGIADDDGVMTLLDYFNYSFATFTTLGFEQFSAETPLAQTVSSIEGVLGVSILALLMFVLGNRISRA
ncbi:MAG: ion channel, partial [Chloroflexota bacterium]